MYSLVLYNRAGKSVINVNQRSSFLPWNTFLGLKLEDPSILGVSVLSSHPPSILYCVQHL